MLVWGLLPAKPADQLLPTCRMAPVPFRSFRAAGWFGAPRINYRSHGSITPKPEGDSLASAGGEKSVPVIVSQLPTEGSRITAVGSTHSFVPHRITLYYMPKESLNVRVEPETREALDAIAEALDRDRSHVVNEALAAYVETHRWQVAHIRQGLREVQSGKFVSGSGVKKVIVRLRRK
jgi:predicted transcriptional regulator